MDGVRIRPDLRRDLGSPRNKSWSMDVERVQAIASLSASLDETPTVFIRPKQEQPGTTTFHGSAPQPPVIDLANQNQTLVTNKIARAAQEWGIFQVVNHGIPTELIQELQAAGKKFFELPAEEKEKYASVPGSLEGYGTQLSKDQHEKKSWFDFLFHNIWPESRINLNVWPKNPPNYRKSNEEYARHILRTANEILKFLSLGLDLDEHVLQDALGGEELELLLKINYYPPCPRPDLASGVVAHTDMCAITILVPNEIPGLQVYKDDQWIDLDYTPGALIVNIGEQIEILSNGKYKGVLHRAAVNKDNLRMSWPVFCSPPGEKIVGPLTQLIDNKNLAKYKAKKYKDYQYCKINKLQQ